jgi:hypothetical protein
MRKWLKEAAPGTRDTVFGTLAHLASVEYAYVRMIEDNPPQSQKEVQTWAAHELSWFQQEMRELGARFMRFIESSTPDALAAPLKCALVHISTDQARGPTPGPHALRPTPLASPVVAFDAGHRDTRSRLRADAAWERTTAL